MIFDGHADIWTDITGKMLNNHEQDIFRRHHLEKFKKGGVTGGIFVMWTDPPYTDNPKQRMDQIVACMEKEIESSKDIMRIVRDYNDFADTDDTRIKVLIGMEGMSHIGKDTSLIVRYYELGVRHASLTWNEENELATGVRGSKDRGLTEAGVLAINTLECLGMLVDVSHLNETSFWDAIKVIKKPFIASHSNAKAICDNPRNLSDAQIKAIAEKGGLIGMNSFRAFVHEDKSLQTIEGLIQHIDHIKKLVGIEHIALGFDFCDYLKSDTMDSFKEHDDENHGLDDLSNIAEVNNLISALRKHGYSEEEIEGISYKNYDRLLKEILS